MGVSGVGKTTLGKLLARKFSLPFFDADDFHSKKNKEKMREGKPLNDEDRLEWLENLKSLIPEWLESKGAVLACSALKEKYRRHISGNNSENIQWIYLFEDFEVISNRIKKRKIHFFNPDLLESQYETLEPPGYGIHLKVEGSPKDSLDKIIQKLKRPQIGIIGLGVMGKNLALNLARNGISVSVYNRMEEGNVAHEFADKYSDKSRFLPFNDLEGFVNSLNTPRNILLMIKSGPPVDDTIKSLLPYLEKDDLIMDGGNSHYKDSERRINDLENQGILYLGVGISGGQEGALNGPSIMPGGSKSAFERMEEVFNLVSARDSENNACCTYIGPGGSGHYVKMVHNGIEYGEMQLIAEFYYFMRFFQLKSPIEISEIFQKWNVKERSFLLEITSKLLKKKEGDAYLIDKVLDVAGQKGTGGWTTVTALESGISLDTITASVFARNISAFRVNKEEIQKLYEKRESIKEDISEDQLYNSFKFASIINHSIGFELLRNAIERYSWHLNLSEIARIWTNGCIIRSSFMKFLVDVYRTENCKHLLLYPRVANQLNERKRTSIRTISRILSSECPMQVTSSALNYFLSFTGNMSSANIIQAQRDYFGAHTYERTDKPRGEFFHTNWQDN